VCIAKCSVCGNGDNTITIEAGGESCAFDTFECAIHALTPTCGPCGCRILGHAVEVKGNFFCCAHCAGSAGNPDLRDRASELLNSPLAPLI
jgi:hypothetical protein